MKKLINDPNDVVEETLEGMAVAHPDLIRVQSAPPRFLVRADAPVMDKVAVVSGGGSGHDPYHAGYTGIGMLDGCVAGEIFTAPTPDQVIETIKATHGGKGVVLIVSNYSGDIMNFEIGSELAADEGIETETVLINDDVSVEDSTYTTGRRGIGATIVAEKICGAAAESRKYDLAGVAEIGRRVNANSRSMGMALSSCTIPAAGKPIFEIADDEMEIGMGVHGEPGRVRMKIKPVDEVVEMLVNPIFDDLPFQEGDRILTFVDSLGATPLSELYIAFRKIKKMCDERGIIIERNLIGPYMTSMEMAGMSLTFMKFDDELLDLWDAPVKTPGMRWGM